MTELDRKQAKADYLNSNRPMGVFQVVNKTYGKMLLDVSNNVPGKINRHRFALNAGSHQNKTLQADWNELGADSFQFEMLEPLEPRDNPGHDYGSDLETLFDLWLEKLEPYGDKGYNERKITREERLRMIAANRKL